MKMSPSDPPDPQIPAEPEATVTNRRKEKRKPNKADRQARLEQFGRDRFASGLLHGIAAMLTPDDVVCDCGANVGVVTAVLAASGATVHSFEPDPHAFAILSERFANVANVILHQAAVGDRSGQVTFYRTDKLDGNPNRSYAGATMIENNRFVKRGKGTPILVDLIEFTAFLTDLLDSGKTVPFIKIDVEGAELGILRRMLDQGLFDRIKLTVAETHEATIPDWADDFAALRRDIGARYPKSRVDLDWI